MLGEVVTGVAVTGARVGDSVGAGVGVAVGARDGLHAKRFSPGAEMSTSARTSTSDHEWATSAQESASTSTSAPESACMRKQLAPCCRSRAHTIRPVAAQIGVSPAAETSTSAGAVPARSRRRCEAAQCIVRRRPCIGAWESACVPWCDVRHRACLCMCAREPTACPSPHSVPVSTQHA